MKTNRSRIIACVVSAQYNPVATFFLESYMRVLTPHLSCVVNMPLSPDEPNEFDLAVQQGYAEIYAVTAEGIIKHHKLRGQNRYIRVKVEKVPGFEPVRLPQAISFLPAGRIPRDIFDQILAFFYKVMEVNGDRALEAMAWICYNPEQGYHVLIPPQTVGGASVSYDWSCVPAGTSIIVDIHSHNNMNAFFSGTDDRDDGGNISFSGVVGQMLFETGMALQLPATEIRSFVRSNLRGCPGGGGSSGMAQSGQNLFRSDYQDLDGRKGQS
jgi:hypothetical protein